MPGRTYRGRSPQGVSQKWRCWGGGSEGDANRQALPSQDHSRRKRRYSGWFPVDDVDFSNSRSLGWYDRFSCGRILGELVAFLYSEENADQAGFLKLRAERVHGRLVCRNNKRLWALKEFQRLRRLTRKFTVNVFLYVTERSGDSRSRSRSPSAQVVMDDDDSPEPSKCRRSPERGRVNEGPEDSRGIPERSERRDRTLPGLPSH
ncbi:unnamed protein product [Symbiodinium pilosum]|uniref:Uncharacterized protein n=1 Tax=Symbiodinium pilosum TaxID=2952 RepID=A0A812Y474_SYMPI|nr:unnamed protein product [Symbiodinium pilosum]